MCIDGTTKFDEEREEDYMEANSNFRVSPTGIMQQFPEIKSINHSLLAKDIPCLIISVEKNKPGHIRSLHEKICSSAEMEGIKMILYVEHTVDALDLPTALWRFCNNLDPKRDQILSRHNSFTQPGKTFACLGLDGTRKTKELDNFRPDPMHPIFYLPHQ